MTKVLISGGSGLLGSNLTKNLELRGHEVVWLSRTPEKSKQKAYFWDPANGEIDPLCLEATGTIFHLSGAGVTAQKWTPEYKEEIYNSRIQSTRVLHQLLLNHAHQVTTFIGASAVGIYGNQTAKYSTEEAPLADTFLAKVCKDWETETQKMNGLGIRTCIIRIGIILSDQGGFIKELAKPAQWGFGAPIGNGQMITPWIHIDDLSRIFLFLMEHMRYSGIFNGVAPYPESNVNITRYICEALHRPQILPAIPEFFLKWMFGEMSEALLASQSVSSQKISSTGFKFQFPDARQAIMDLLRNK